MMVINIIIIVLHICTTLFYAKRNYIANPSSARSNHGNSSYDNTMTTTASNSFAGLNNSTAYKYNPAESSSYASSTRTATTNANPAYTVRGAYVSDADDDDDDDDTPLARVPVRLGSESGASGASTISGRGVGPAGGPGGGMRFKVVNADDDGDGAGVGAGAGVDVDGMDLGLEGEERAANAAAIPAASASGKEVKEKKSSIWGTKIASECLLFLCSKLIIAGTRYRKW
ncbi:hypothetical protein BDZ97DRAFT_1805886 [Flammula alnicola]|nr:hypothetical protein BDZ97DRAFT_1805886 [Flammula alnicola]